MEMVMDMVMLNSEFCMCRKMPHDGAGAERQQDR